MNIGIIGVGAIGGWLAAKLALAGHRVTCVVRGETLARLGSGLVLRSAKGEERAEVRAADAAPAEAQDLVILATKAHGLAAASEAARAMVGPNTLILPLQNGVPWWFVDGERLNSVDPDGRIAAALPVAQVIGAVVHASAQRIGPAENELVHADKLLLGEPSGGTSARVERLCLLLRDTGVPAQCHDNIRQAIWYKLWGNMTINPLSALTRATADRLVGDEALRPFILAAMAEAAEIGARIGCPMRERGEARLEVTKRLGAFKTSMLQDLEAGRPLELEALVGAPREIGRRIGMPTPAIDALYAMTRLLDESVRRPS